MNRIPPQDLHAEQGLLGCLLAYGKMEEIELTADEFYDRRHGMIFEAMGALYEDNSPIDLVTVTSWLDNKGNLQRVGGAGFIAELSEISVSPIHGEHYASLIRDKAKLRSFLAASEEAIGTIYAMQGEPGVAIEEAEQLIYKASSAIGVKKGPNPFSAGLKECLANMEAKRSGGMPTGFSAIDSLIVGLFPSDLFILAGRPGMGKSALAVQLGINVAKKHGAVAVFSLEMSEDNCIKRILSGEANIPYERIRKQLLTSDDWAGLTAAADRIFNIPLFIDDTEAVHHLDIRKRVRRLCSKYDVKLVIIDYLQLVRGSKESREEEISEISRSLKALAKEINIPVLALAQLNRKCEDREEKRPRLSDLRESGAIEQDADVVAFVYREKAYNKNADDIAEVIVNKQRNGPLGTAKLFFRGAMVRFEALGWEDS